MSFMEALGRQPQISDLGSHPEFEVLEELLVDHRSTLEKFFRKMFTALDKQEKKIHFFRQHSMDAVLFVLGTLSCRDLSSSRRHH